MAALGATGRAPGELKSRLGLADADMGDSEREPESWERMQLERMAGLNFTLGGPEEAPNKFIAAEL